MGIVVVARRRNVNACELNKSVTKADGKQEARAADVEARVAEVEAKMDGVQSGVQGLGTKLESVEGKLEAIMQTLLTLSRVGAAEKDTTVNNQAGRSINRTRMGRPPSPLPLLLRLQATRLQSIKASFIISYLKNNSRTGSLAPLHAMRICALVGEDGPEEEQARGLHAPSVAHHTQRRHVRHAAHLQ